MEWRETKVRDLADGLETRTLRSSRIIPEVTVEKNGAGC